jgi:hypothetical protein
VELSDAGVRLRCGVELKLPDDVVLFELERWHVVSWVV